MPFHVATCWRERGLQLQELKDNCNAILKGLNAQKCDARAQGMIHVRQMCNTLAAVPMKLQQNAGCMSNVPVICAILGVSGPHALERQLRDLNKNSKCAFITMVQFALENCVNSVLGALPGTCPGSTFSESAKRALQAACLPCRESDNKYQLLMVPAWIRNTLHANGFHNKSTIAVSVGGEPFTFRYGQRVNCGSWSHLFWALSHALRVYEMIFVSSAVSSIPHVAAR